MLVQLTQIAFLSGRRDEYDIVTAVRYSTTTIDDKPITSGWRFGNSTRGVVDDSKVIVASYINDKCSFVTRGELKVRLFLDTIIVK